MLAAFSFLLGMKGEENCFSYMLHTENYLLWQCILANAMKILFRVNSFLPRIYSVLYIKAENGPVTLSI